MRYAGDKIKNNESIYGNPGSYLEDNEVLPNTNNVRYPQDNLPAQDFGGEINPTELPMMRQEYMKSPSGGLSQLAPRMVDGYVDHPAVQDSGMPYILTPDIQQKRRESMNQFQGLPTDMLKRFGFKGV
jgi:hypothetical protein